MSNRLDKEREAKLQPVRVQMAIDKLTALGKYVECDETTVWFIHNGYMVTYWPYSGWHSGKSIKDGRGLHKLLKQLK